MSVPSSQFERLSFWELLGRHSVQIPVIQRDYAQGRESNTKVLDGLLRALRAAFDNEPVELDFVFGDVKDGCFRPVDGQQRLTTLFLLHWYAARAASLSPEVYSPTLARFSYVTRISSRDFCKRLVDEDVMVDSLSPSESLSQSIRDYPWFVGAWQFDPTVAGMLEALDKISALEWPEDLWQRLTSSDSTPIRFLLVELKKFGISDDLYIKMNARGKPLTSFESFKALLGERVVDQGWENDLDTEDKFAIRVDTRWTDYFWNLCPSEASGLKRIDGVFLSFIAHSLACSIASHAVVAEKVADDLRALLNDPESMEAEAFRKIHYQELRGQLQRLSDRPAAVAEENREHWEFAEAGLSGGRSIMREVIQSSGPQYKARLILYAQLRLHETSELLPQESMADWRRVVRNVLAHSVAESPEDFVAGIRLLDELTQGRESVHEFLAATEIRSRFSATQVSEERRKARLLVQYPEQKALLQRLEDSSFLRGRISFALDCVSEGAAAVDFDFKNLSEVAEVIDREFGEGITSEIRRAFFTIGDGAFFMYWSSWFFAKRLPKYCLIADDRDFRDFSRVGHPSRGHLKSFVMELIGSNCAQLIADYQPAPGSPNWRTRLVREGDLIDRATACYIALDEHEGVVYPIPGVRPHDNAANQEYLEENKIQ